LGDVPNTDVVESFKSEEELLQRFFQKYLHRILVYGNLE